MKQNKQTLAVEHVEWIRSNFNWVWNNMVEDFAPFDVAMASLTEDIYTMDSRVRIANLWTGIEGLLKPPERRLSANLISRMTKILDTPSKKRIVKLWHKYRCKSVHGVKIEGDLDKVADEIYALFCSLIKHFIESRIIPTSDVLDTMFPVIETEYTCPHCKKEIR